jgi:hypothetical protein
MKPADLLHALFSGLLAVAAVYAAVTGVLPELSLCIVGLCDIYILAMLGIVSLKPATPRWVRIMPHSSAGVFLVAGMVLVAFIFGYANLYVASRGVVQQSFEIVEGQRGPTVEPGRWEVVREPKEAVYFSIVTMSTLGYGDCLPATETAKRLVAWEIASGFLMVFVVFPLMVSRLAISGNFATGDSRTEEE